MHKISIIYPFDSYVTLQLNSSTDIVVKEVPKCIITKICSGAELATDEINQQYHVGLIKNYAQFCNYTNDSFLIRM